MANLHCKLASGALSPQEKRCITITAALYKLMTGKPHQGGMEGERKRGRIEVDNSNRQTGWQNGEGERESITAAADA